jgi:hypothetical protein
MRKTAFQPNTAPRIHWGNTFAALSRAVEEHDYGKPRKQRLHQCWDLLKAIYKAYIRKYEQGLTRQGSFAVTHGYLAFDIKRSTRTVFRQMKRVSGTPFIHLKERDMEKFTGKNLPIHCVRIYINQDFIRLAGSDSGGDTVAAPAKASSGVPVEAVDKGVQRTLLHSKKMAQMLFFEGHPDMLTHKGYSYHSHHFYRYYPCG